MGSVRHKDLFLLRYDRSIILCETCMRLSYMFSLILICSIEKSDRLLMANLSLGLGLGPVRYRP